MPFSAMRNNSSPRRACFAVRLCVAGVSRRAFTYSNGQPIVNNQHVPGKYPGVPEGMPFAPPQPGPAAVGAPPSQPYAPPGGLMRNAFRPHPYGSSASHPHEAAASYVTPPPNTMGQHGFLLKHGTANDPVDAYRPEPGETGIIVDASYFRWWMAVYLYATTKPRIFVDGIEVPDVSWGATHVPAPPGLHHVEVCTGKAHWFFRNFMSGWSFDIGFADTVVPVTDGRRTPVYYRPLHCACGQVRSARNRRDGQG